MPDIHPSRPAYQQIASAIRRQVQAGELAPGDKVPSEAETIREWHVHKSTVAKANALLKSWGIIETQVGSATRIAPGAVSATMSGPSDHTERLLRAVPIYAEGERSDIYEASVLTTDNVSTEIVQAVDLPSPAQRFAGEATTIIKRARKMYRDDELVGVCTTWINHPLVVQQPGGRAAVEALTSLDRIPGGTGRYLLDLFGVDLTHDTTRVGIRPVPVSVARELAVEPGTRMLWLLATRYADEYVVEVDEWFRFGDVSFS